jgi:hypothetical protein
MTKAYTKKQKAQRAAEEKSREEGLMHLHHEIFSQLMQIPQAAVWIAQNIRIQHDIDEESKTIDVKVMYIGQDQDEDQLIVQCPGCQLKFDANQEAPQITLATKIPDDAEFK